MSGESIKKLGALFLVIFVMMNLFVACGAQTEGAGETTTTATAAATSATEATDPALDISKKVEITMYLAGDGAADSEMVNAELNKRMEADLNCTIKVINIPWADWDQKYPLILTSGEKYDLIYASGWASYFDYAAQGCFLAVDDLLPKYAPDVLAQLDEAQLNTGKGADGRQYGIPANTKLFGLESFLVRGDIIEKNNLAPVTDLATLEAYLEAARQTEKDIVPFYANPTQPWTMLATTDLIYVTGAKYRMYSHESNLRAFEAMEFLPEFEEWALKAKSWYDKGYIQKDVLTTTDLSFDVFANGKSAFATGNETQMKQAAEKVLASNPEWKPIINSFYLTTGKGLFSTYGMNTDGMCIGKNSENPERALMVLNKIRTDRECYDLLFYGTKGRNFDLDSNGNIILPAGVTADTNGYPWENEGQWGMRVDSFIRTSPTDWADYNTLVDKFKAGEYLNPLAGFLLNSKGFDNEIAAMSEIYSQYTTPLKWGISTDVAKDIAALKAKLTAAGIEKYKEAAANQLNAYLDSIGYKD